MSKGVMRVFLVIAALVIVLLAWRIIFGQQGVIQGAWNGMARYVNSIYEGISGNSNDELIPLIRGGDGAKDDFKSAESLEDANTIADEARQ